MALVRVDNERYGGEWMMVLAKETTESKGSKK
jgi:hypothetical protein